MNATVGTCSRCSGLIEAGDNFCQDCGLPWQDLRSPLLQSTEEKRAKSVAPSHSPIAFSTKLTVDSFLKQVHRVGTMTVPDTVMTLAVITYCAAAVFSFQRANPQWYLVLKQFPQPKPKVLPQHVPSEITLLLHQCERRAQLDVLRKRTPVASVKEVNKQDLGAQQAHSHDVHRQVVKSDIVYGAQRKSLRSDVGDMPRISKQQAEELGDASLATGSVQSSLAQASSNDSALAKDDSEGPKSKSASAAPSASKVKELAQYNKLLAQFFSKSQSDASSEQKDPPSFQEWVDSKKAPF